MARYDDLLATAKKLGVPTGSGVYKPMAEPWAELQITEYELHRRIKEEERRIREQRLWMLALASAITSLLSAIGAWMAVISANPS